MRHIISADYHLQETMRFDDYVCNIKQIEKIAIKEKPDVYDIVGDIFNKRKPSPMELKIFARHLSEMLKIVKKINISVGNHDWIDESLTTLDWIIDKRIKVAKEIKLKEGKKTILLTHRTIAEAKLGPDEIHISGISYKALKYDVIIAGHIHKPQIVNKSNPLTLIPGSIERVNFGERGENKSVWILDVNSKGIKLKGHRLKCRPMYYIECNLDTREAKVNGKRVTHLPKIEGAIIKVKFYGKKSTIHKINYDKFIAAFDKAYSLNDRYEYTDIPGEQSEKIKDISDENELINEYFKEQNVPKEVQKKVWEIMK